jgi:ElaB/YqjD/DUF883 family membrane-anchored ribosome-binding protein
MLRPSKENQVNNGNGDINEMRSNLERLTKIEKVVKAKVARAQVEIAETASDAANKVDAAADELSSGFEAAEAKIRDSAERLLETMREFTGAAGNQLKAHPLAAFGVAFVAGIAVARLLRRS